MIREDFSRRVLEQQIFDELKDTSLRSAEYFKAKYQGTDIDYSRLYRRIVNYQISTYGCSLNGDTYIRKKTYEECLRAAQRSRQRRYNRISRNRYERKN